MSFLGDMSQSNVSVMAKQGGAESLTSSSAHNAVYETGQETCKTRQSNTECFTSSRVLQDSPAVGKTCNVFVYSKPKFPDFVGGKDIMNHFREYSPIDAFVFKTGTAKIIFPSEVMAEKAMMAKNGTKVLEHYSISLKFENPAHPPKAESEKSHLHSKWESTTASSQEAGSLLVVDSSSQLQACVDGQNPFIAKAISRKGSDLPQSERAESSVQAKDTACEDMKLLPGQWNRLMMIGPGNTTLLEDMITPYKDNSNIDIRPVLEKKVLQFTGKKETVQSALKYFTVQLKKKDLEIDR